jgi:hypothetical protein
VEPDLVLEGELMDLRDLTGRPDWQEWSGKILAESVPQMERSRASMILYSGTHEPKQAIEIGFAILMNKPIVLVHMPGVEPPWKLKKIANYVIECDNTTEEGKAEFSRKFQRIMRSI